MRVKCLAQEHNAVPRPGLEPGPPDPDYSALTIRPPRLPLENEVEWSYSFSRGEGILYEEDPPQYLNFYSFKTIFDSTFLR